MVGPSGAPGSWTPTLEYITHILHNGVMCLLSRVQLFKVRVDRPPPKGSVHLTHLNQLLGLAAPLPAVTLVCVFYSAPETEN